MLHACYFLERHVPAERSSSAINTHSTSTTAEYLRAFPRHIGARTTTVRYSPRSGRFPISDAWIRSLIVDPPAVAAFDTLVIRDQSTCNSLDKCFRIRTVYNIVEPSSALRSYRYLHFSMSILASRRYHSYLHLFRVRFHMPALGTLFGDF